MNKIIDRLQMNKVIQPLENTPKNIISSIFLAGPVPRKQITSWRAEAIKYLYNHGYNGTIYNPETSTANYENYYNEQFAWEHDKLDKSDIIVFWIPRIIKNNEALGLTTNIEFGLYAKSNKLIVGFPKDADEIEYIKKCCEENNIPFYYTLEEVLNRAIEMTKNKMRFNTECDIPLFIWENEQFQHWYQRQLNVGNQLLSLKCLYNFFMPEARKLFLWICHAKVYIKAEDRIKDNEFIISRTDMSSVVLYYKDNVVLIKEYRTPCCNKECYVYELPGGSSINSLSAINTAKNEVLEEAGINIPLERFELISNRQACATLSAHFIHAYKVQLTQMEFSKIKSMENTIHGLHNDGEYTYLIIKNIKEILNDSLLDWDNIGIILSALYEYK